MMNFVIFPVFFASVALYPLWRLEDIDPQIAWLARLNPFSHAVELIRFALYVRFEPLAAAVSHYQLQHFTACGRYCVREKQSGDRVGSRNSLAHRREMLA